MFSIMFNLKFVNEVINEKSYLQAVKQWIYGKIYAINFSQ